MSISAYVTALLAIAGSLYRYERFTEVLSTSHPSIFLLAFGLGLEANLSVAVVKCQKEVSNFIQRRQMYNDERQSKILDTTQIQQSENAR